MCHVCVINNNNRIFDLMLSSNFVFCRFSNFSFFLRKHLLEIFFCSIFNFDDSVNRTMSIHSTCLPNNRIIFDFTSKIYKYMFLYRTKQLKVFNKHFFSVNFYCFNYHCISICSADVFE